MALDFRNFSLERSDLIVRFRGVKLGDSLDLNVRQARDVFLRNFSKQVTNMGLQALPNVLQHLLPGFGFFDIAVNTLFDEDLFQARKMPLLLKLGELDVEVRTEQVYRMLRRTL